MSNPGREREREREQYRTVHSFQAHSRTIPGAFPDHSRTRTGPLQDHSRIRTLQNNTEQSLCTYIHAWGTYIHRAGQTFVKVRAPPVATPLFHLISSHHFSGHRLWRHSFLLFGHRQWRPFSRHITASFLWAPPVATLLFHLISSHRFSWHRLWRHSVLFFGHRQWRSTPFHITAPFLRGTACGTSVFLSVIL